MGWKTSVATVVVEGTSAVNELLLSERGEFTVGNQLMGLKGSDSGESPAASTLALVLNGRNLSRSSPVELSWSLGESSNGLLVGG